jgi:phosphosulfolactate phosphohydrolase-like enzyme
LCIEAVKHDGRALQYVLNQTDKICLETVKKYGWALEYVKKQTPEINMAAVKSFGRSLEYIENQTPELCLEAVKSMGLALEYVKEQTSEICLAAVKNTGYALQYVKEQTPEICLAAVKESEFVFNLVKKQTPEIVLAAVSREHFYGETDFSNRDILIALAKNGHYHWGITRVSYISKIPEEYRDEELYLLVVSNNGDVLEDIDVEKQTEKICIAAIKNKPTSIQYVINQTPELCMYAVLLDKKAMEYVDLSIFE